MSPWPAWATWDSSSKKQNKTKFKYPNAGVWECSLVVEHLPIVNKALNLIPNTGEEEGKKKKIQSKMAWQVKGTCHQPKDLSSIPRSHIVE